MAQTSPKRLSTATLARLVRVEGGPVVGYGLEVHGLFGTEELLQTPNRALAHHLCNAVRDFVRAMPPARQHQVFAARDLQLAQMGRLP